MSISRRTFLKGTSAAAVLSQLGMVRAEAKERAAALDGDYALGEGVVYLNHASIGTVPRLVLEAHKGYLDMCETNPWLYQWSDPWQEPREQTRAKAAALFGCAPDEMAITHNTTELFNMLAHGLPLGPGDEVLFSTLNHTGASACWQHRAAERGFTARRFDFSIADIAQLSVDDVVARYADAIGPATQVLALPHIDNTIGLRHPVRDIAKMAHDRGVRWVVVDGAQSASMIPIDMDDLGVDAYATSAHKWIQSPKGLGLGFVSRATQEDCSAMWVTWGQGRWGESARKYEDYGTRAMPAVTALGDALDFQARVDEADREQRHRELWNAHQDIVRAADHLEWRSHTDWSLSCALHLVEVRGRRAGDVAAEVYEEHGIVLRPFTNDELNAVRISPNLMTSVDDLQMFADVTRD